MNTLALLLGLATASLLFGWLSWNVRFKTLAPLVLGSGGAIGLLGWALWMGTPLWWAGAMMLGALFMFSLLEYLIHRYIFHYRGPRGLLAPLIYDLHESHHAVPHHIGLQATSLVVVFPVTVLGGLSLINHLGVATGGTLLAGLLIGYVYYEWTHYKVHNCPSKYVHTRWQQRLHRYHHHRDDQRNYGVTSPLWDWVFGTLTLPQRAKG